MSPLSIVLSDPYRSHYALTKNAAGLGLEPRYTVPETVVLPLDDPAILECPKATPVEARYLKEASISRLLPHSEDNAHNNQGNEVIPCSYKPVLPRAILPEH